MTTGAGTATPGPRAGPGAMRLELLVVDDDDVDRERVRRLLARSAPLIAVSEAASGAEALAQVRVHAYDCVVLDNELGDTSGAELLPQLHSQSCTGFPVVFVTGAGNESLAVQVLRQGAADYLVKTQLNAEGLARAVQRSVEHFRLEQENEDLHRRLARRVEAQAAAIRQGERDLRALINNSPMVMGCWDRNLRCRFGNRTHADWFGVDAERLPGLHLDQVLPPDLRAACAAAIAEVLEGRRGSVAAPPFEHSLSAAAGRPQRHVQVQLSPDRNDLGQVAGFYLTLTDVSAIKLAQRHAHAALVEARDVAESAARAKSAFLANISHEIRTPMNAIVGLSRLALDDPLPPRALDFITKVHGSAVALMGLLDDVLDYSKIDAGHLRLERIAFDLEDLLQQVVDLFQARAVQKGLALDVVLAPGLQRQRWGDPLRLSQLLNNLVGNALKFTAAGQVRLTVQAEAFAAGADERLRFCVADTGIGIEPEHQAQLFQAFVQADDSVTRRYGGSGLGLAICKRLVQLMDGDIGLASQQGQGTQVWFSVPLAPVDSTGDLAPLPQRLQAEALAAFEAQAPAMPWDGAGWRVLVVEDNPLNQLVCTEMLHRLGLASQVAEDGLAAVAAVAAAPPGHFQLVLMDLHMPGMGGLEATRRIHALPTAGELPIVGLTAAAMPDDRQQCLDAGMLGHLAKPVLPEQLQALMQQLAPQMLGQLQQPLPDPAALATPLSVLDLAGAAGRLRLGEAVMQRMLGLFAEREAGTAQALARQQASGDWAAVYRKAHDLKGSAATLGAESLAAAAATLQDLLEQCFGAGGPASAAASVHAMPTAAELAPAEAGVDVLRQALDQALAAAALQLGRKPSTDR